MSAQTIRLIHCDASPDGPSGPPCMAPSPDFPLIPLTVLRKVLRTQHGWHSRSGRDICPTCWVTGHR